MSKNYQPESPHTEINYIKLIGDKDSRIQELEELVKQGSLISNTTIFLPSKFAFEIYQCVSINRLQELLLSSILNMMGNK